ncbi:PREDICTED: exosome complex component RRP46-like isoform X2 [Priapulus caudatus]|uniref:Exosome complex component RRP46-like isoform X2 n=1 Tax=Priapulus caudatus TaxID=37621 RepID=A0ABM1EIE2_PRICU|nr:PREDICTED: exosome complex component RRP46-like isoform X2 [Priapulus caudatus]
MSCLKQSNLRGFACEQSCLTRSDGSATFNQGCKEKATEQLIKSTCETVLLVALHPRTAVVIVLQEMQNTGSLLSCCINACCQALMDAGINMRCLVCAVTTTVDQEGHIILDPTSKQEEDGKAVLTFAFDSKTNGVIMTTTSGIYSSQEYQECLLSAQHASAKIFEFYRDSILKKLSRVS